MRERGGGTSHQRGPQRGARRVLSAAGRGVEKQNAGSELEFLNMHVLFLLLMSMLLIECLVFMTIFFSLRTG